MPVTATAPTMTPADYVTAADVYATTDITADTDDEGLLARAITDATGVIWAATGRQYTGVIAGEKIRPCCTSYLCCGGGLQDLWVEAGAQYVPQIVHGNWYNLGGPYSLRTCVAYDCNQLYGRLDLFVYPVTAVTVMVDGAEFTDCRIDENRYLTRLDGALWPVTQNVLLDDTQPGTWSVTITHGIDPPAQVKSATARLAAELVKANDPDGRCALPKTILTVNRAGITYSLPNVIDLVSKGRTGIYEIDMAVQSVNPRGLMERPRIASPEQRPHRHQGG